MILRDVWGSAYGNEAALPAGLRPPAPPQARRRRPTLRTQPGIGYQLVEE